MFSLLKGATVTLDLHHWSATILYCHHSPAWHHQAHQNDREDREVGVVKPADLPQPIYVSPPPKELDHATNHPLLIASFPQSLTDADTLAIWKELDSARTTLAQIQALRIEMGGATCNCSPEPPKLSDTSITSEQWLEVYGLKAKKLMFDHLVQSLAFKHCNGIVQIPLPPKHKRTGKVEMVSALTV